MTRQEMTGSENNDSLWRDTVHFPSFPPLREDQTTDTLVVGAGLTGVTAAWLLAQNGIPAMLIDAGTIASGTSGNTTAKITAQHGLIYADLIRMLGEAKAARYYQANQAALQWMEERVQTQHINCGFSRQPAIIYAATEKEARQIEKEKDAYDRLGIPGTLTDRTALPFSIHNALIMPGQAQFHPLMYLYDLLAEVVQKDVAIYEHTEAVDLHTAESGSVVRTQQGAVIHCRHVLICSHFPFYDRRLYFARMFPERSYLIACATDAGLPEGMFLSAGNPKRSLRGVHVNHQDYLLIGGENHKTGRGESTERHYERLADFARTYFDCRTVTARWSAQDFTTLDRIPYIGRIAADCPHVWVAAGFRKWGMTTATLAARLLVDQVLERANPYADLFRPSRFAPRAMLPRFFIENVRTAGQLLKGKLSRPRKLDAQEVLKNGCGVIASLHGRRVGACRGEDGRLTVVDTTCPHMGCEVNWNQGEQTWDCPCHGSRFTARGEVIDGPAKEPLSVIFADTGLPTNKQSAQSKTRE